LGDASTTDILTRTVLIFAFNFIARSIARPFKASLHFSVLVVLVFRLFFSDIKQSTYL
jgi:hypothetical protein